jgi:NADPH:quinone reductase-like Zn-dependent oxidoreductase
MKIFEYRGFGLENLVLAERETPRPAGREVVVKFRAASLNYRDVLFCKGVYKPDASFPVIPFCDGAGEVIATGREVTRWKTGDRVCPIFMPGWLDGRSLGRRRGRPWAAAIWTGSCENPARFTRRD